MNKNLADITVVMDRSGSMDSCRTDAEGGLNQFVRQQKELPGEALFTLVQFNTIYEFVHKGIPIGSVPAITLNPSGGTALLDALGRAIIETGERLRSMPEASRPGLVTVVVITDGQENSSKEFTKQKVKEMVEHQQSVYNWRFIYLGANQDAFTEAGGLGFWQGSTSNYSEQKTGGAILKSANLVGNMRAAASRGLNTNIGYTDKDRQEIA